MVVTSGSPCYIMGVFKDGKSELMTAYQFPYKDAEFLINDLIDFDSLCSEAGLEEIVRLAARIIVPNAPV